MRIREVDTDSKRDVRRWVTFPLALYRGCEQWVPPLLADEVNGFHRHQHPFFEHSTAALYLAERGGEPVGRIAVMDNRNANRYRGTNTAFFGYFDAVDDVEVSRALFGAAFAWARARGLDCIIGTRGLIGSDASGVLVEGFEHRAALGVPYNYAYYDALIVDAGFEVDTEHLSGYLPGDYQLPERLGRIAEAVRERRGFWIKSFSSKDEMRAWVSRVAAVHREAFVSTHTFYPPTEAEMEAIAETIIGVAEPGLIKLVMKGEDVVGFILAYRDFSAGLQRAHGRLWPLGWIHILRDRRRSKWVNVNGVGLLPDLRNLGGNAVLYTELDRSIKSLGFEHVDVVLVDVHNKSSRSDMEAIGVQWYKRHRSYARVL